MTDRLIAVTGVTGAVGRRVAHRLADRGHRLRLLARDPARAPRLPGGEVRAADYADGEAMRAALAGVDTLLLVSATEHPDRVALHRTAVDAAVATGVSRIVYTSFLNAAAEATFTFARDHWHTEQHIRASGLAHTFLRDSLYQDVLPAFVGRDGVLRGPAGDGRGSAVTRDDVAEVAVAVLTDPAHAGETYDVTGPEALSLTEVAELLTTATGRPVSYHAETLTEAYGSRAGYGAPEWTVAGWVSTYTAIAAGELATVADTVHRLTGRPPTRFADFLTRR